MLVSIRSQLIRAFRSPVGTSKVIFAAAFLVATGIGQIIGIGLAYFARDIHGVSPSVVGLLNGTWSICYVVGLLALRSPLSRLRPSAQILLGMAAAVAGTLGMQHAPNVTMLAVLTGATGMSLSLFWPPLLGWLTTGFEGEKLGRILGHFNLSWSTGIIVGPYLCGWLTQLSPRLPLYVATAVFGATFALVGSAVLLAPEPDPGAGLADEGNEPATPAASTAFRWPAWTGLVASFFAMGTVVTVFPLAGRGELGLSASLVGAVFAVRALTNTVTFVLMGRVSFWHFRLWPMVVSLLLTSMALLGLALSREVVPVAASMALLGVVASVSYNASIFHGSSGAPDRSKRMAIHEALLSVGLLSGSLAGGWLYERSDMLTAYLAAAVLVAVTIPVVVLVARLTKRA